MTEVHETQRAEERGGYREQHDQRIDEALVLRRQHEEDEDEAQRKNDRAQLPAAISSSCRPDHS